MPGPGAYDSLYKNKDAFGAKIGTSKRGNMGKSDTPGPGAYDSLHGGKGGVTISGHKGKSKIDENPGPGTYNPDENGTRIRPSSAKYFLFICSIGKSQRSQLKRNDGPGPGQYYQHDSHNYKFAYTKETRSKDMKKQEPGPGRTV